MSTLRTVYTNLVAARTTIRDVRRFRQIATVLVRHGFGFLFSRLSRSDRAVARAVERALEEPVDQAGEGAPPPQAAPGRAMAVRFRQTVEDLGPTFIKFGQILSTRPDLIPPVLSEELQGLQDDVPPMPLDAVVGVVRAELGQDPSKVFERFDEAPLAAGSIAQVHRARLRTGEEVAVKVQRPGIREVIEADLDILYFLARQLETVLPESQLFDPTGIVREFERAIHKELDFQNEARNMERFDKNFREIDWLHVPTVHRGHSTGRVLTMEFIDGVKITEAVERGLGDAQIVARRALWSLFYQFFKHGFFHGDLHPGNILVLPDNRLCFLDFGLAGRLTPEMKDRVVDMLFAIGRQDFDQLARVLYEIGHRTGPVDYEAFVADTYEAAEVFLEDTPLAEVNVGALLQELFQKALRHQMRVPTTYTMMMKALVTVEGLGKRIAPDLDLVEEAQPFITELVRERYSPERVRKRLTEGVYVANRLMGRLPHALRRVLDDLESGHLGVNVQVPQLDRLLEERRRSDVLWSLGLVYATLMVSATLALSFDTWRILGVPAFSLVGYVLALPAGAMLLRAWWRR